MQCKRCGLSAPALERAPLPGEVGRELLESTCRPCWEGWLREQVKWINELRLAPTDPQHYELLVLKMREYLRF